VEGCQTAKKMRRTDPVGRYYRPPSVGLTWTQVLPGPSLCALCTKTQMIPGATVTACHTGVAASLMPQNSTQLYRMP